MRPVTHTLDAIRQIRFNYDIFTINHTNYLNNYYDLDFCSTAVSIVFQGIKETSPVICRKPRKSSYVKMVFL